MTGSAAAVDAHSLDGIWCIWLITCDYWLAGSAPTVQALWWCSPRGVGRGMKRSDKFFDRVCSRS